MIVSRFKVDGFRSKFVADFDLKPDVNYLIGRNGTGKTTIAKILVDALKCNANALSRAEFFSISLTLEDRSTGRTFQLDYLRPVIDTVKQSTGSFLITLDGSDLPNPIRTTSRHLQRARRRLIGQPRSWTDLSPPLSEDGTDDVTDVEAEAKRAELHRTYVSGEVEIRKLLKTVVVRWLPVERSTRQGGDPDEAQQNTVDAKVEELQNLLVRYFSELDKSSAAESEKFRNDALLSLFKVESGATNFKSGDIARLEKELKSLIPELRLDGDSERRFTANSQALLDRLRARERGRPLEALRQAVARLEEIVGLWRRTQNRVETIFAQRDSFLRAIEDAFSLTDLRDEDRDKFKKRPELDESNEIAFYQENSSGSPAEINLSELSSGEKQFFIMLSEALLERSQEVVLIIDEPELSLHITWQARLVQDIQQLNPNAQLILATHSPDIAQFKRANIIQIESALSVCGPNTTKPELDNHE